MTKVTLYLMLGYPGSGKTTTSRSIAKLTGAIHLWADHERRHRFSKPTHSHQENLELYEVLNQKTIEYLNAGKSVIFDTSFNLYKDRERLRAIATAAHANCVLVWVTTPDGVAKARALHETHRDKNGYTEKMSASDFDRLSTTLELPHPDEKYVEIDGTKITDSYVAKQLGL